MGIKDIRLNRSIGSYSKVQLLVSPLLRNNPLRLKFIKHLEYLNIGCGPYPQDGFINMDLHWMPGVNLCWDLRKGFPFRECSLRGIFTEHCLEHSPFEQSQQFLFSFYKSLKPGGVLRIVVPDAELYISKYVEAKRTQVAWPYGEQDSEHTPLMLMNHIWLEHGHKAVYDFETLGMMLKKAGFRYVRKEAYHQGRHPMLLRDLEGRQVESMYVEAQK